MPVGVFRNVERPTYSNAMRSQIDGRQGEESAEPGQAVQLRQHLDGGIGFISLIYGTWGRPKGRPFLFSGEIHGFPAVA